MLFEILNPNGLELRKLSKKTRLSVFLANFNCFWILWGSRVWFGFFWNWIWSILIDFRIFKTSSWKAVVVTLLESTTAWWTSMPAHLKSVLSLKTVNKQLDVQISALRLSYVGHSQCKIRNIQLFVYRL